MISSVFNKFQDAVVTRLARRSDLKGISVLARRNGSIAAQIRENVACSGLCVVVMPPRAKDISSTAQTPVFTVVTVCVRVIENVYHGHGGRDAMSVAETVSRALQSWQPTVLGITAPLMMDSDDAWSMDDEPDSKGRYTIEINFATSASV